MNRWPEPGTVAWLGRKANTSTMTLSGCAMPLVRLQGHGDQRSSVGAGLGAERHSAALEVHQPGLARLSKTT